MSMNGKELFERAFSLEVEILDSQELLKELKKDFTYDDDNPEGLDKDEVARITKAAKVHAKQVNLKEKIEEMQEIDRTVEEFS